MGMIGHFIDRACARRPHVMRRVYARTFGDLEWFITDRQHGDLIGSIALAAGRCGNYGEDSVRVVSELLGTSYAEPHDVGMATWNIVCRDLLHDVSREDAEARTVALIKARIAKRLGIPAGPTCAHCGTTIPGTPIRARSADGLMLAFCSDAHREADDRHMRYMLGGRQRTAEYLNLDDAPAPSMARAARRAAWGDL